MVVESRFEVPQLVVVVVVVRHSTDASGTQFPANAVVYRVVLSEYEVWYSVPQYRARLEDLDDSTRRSTPGPVVGDLFDVGFWGG